MTYRSRGEIPILVREAMRGAREQGFECSCTTEVGRLLRVLAARVRGGTIGEIGAGCGVGASWIVSGLRVGTQFVTVETDAGRADVAREVLRGYQNVHVLVGDWHDILAYAPFDLLFVDVREAKRDDSETVLCALKPGGTVLIDDLTPEVLWPPEWHGHPDPVREFWLHESRLLATELLVDERNAVILATRLQN